MEKKNAKKRMKARNKSLTIVVIVLAVVCLCAGGIYIDTFYGKGLVRSFFAGAEKKEDTAEQILEKMELDISSKASMAVFGKEFLLSTKDGVKYYTAMGAQKWSDTFNMSSPTMVQEGEYIAVGDMGGKAVRVYNREGLLYDLQAEGTPVQFALNEKGYLSLISKNETAYHIRIYNAEGTLLKERVEESKGIYPLCSDVSDDSRSFAVSYLDTTDIQPIGRVLLFYISANDSENYTDSIFAAAVEKTDELIPLVSYRENGVLAVISDKCVYGIGSDGGELWNYALENTIDQTALGEKGYIILALGDSVADKDGREKGTVIWLDDSGKEKTSYESGDSVTYLLAAEKGVVIGNDRRYAGVNHSGSEGWNYTATADMSDLIPMEKWNRVLVVGKDTAAIMDMKKEQKAEVQPEQKTETEIEIETDGEGTDAAKQDVADTPAAE